jgi:hypothetical protein
MPDLALSIVLGIALAAATGFRVFLPMLIVSGAAHTGHLQLDNSFAWLGTPSAMTMLAVAAFAEVLEPIREVWAHDEWLAASRLSMMRIMARRMNAATVVA